MIVTPTAPLVPIRNSIRTVPRPPLLAAAALTWTIRPAIARFPLLATTALSGTIWSNATPAFTGSVGTNAAATFTWTYRTLFATATFARTTGTDAVTASRPARTDLFAATAGAWSRRRQCSCYVTGARTSLRERSRTIMQERGSRTACHSSACHCSAHTDTGSRRPTATTDVEKVIEIACRRTTTATAWTNISATRPHVRSIRDVARVNSTGTSDLPAARSRAGRWQVAHVRPVGARTTHVRPAAARGHAGRGSAHLRPRGWARHGWSPPCSAAAVTAATAWSSASSAAATCTTANPSATPAATAETAATATAAGQDFGRYPGDCRQQANGYDDVAFHDRT
jgi:trimeric autotransporter adhesin